MSKKELSQFDGLEAIRSSHQFENDALRVTSANTSVPPCYSRVALTYNAAKSVTNAQFYEGTLAEVRHIEFEADDAGNLNNTYFDLYSEYDESLYHVWYNVNGAGVDPAPAGSVGLEVTIDTNDPASIVALATKLVIEPILDFKVSPLSDTKLKIENKRLGTATTTTDNGTGFDIQTVQDGSEKLIKNVDVPYANGIRYIFNEQEKKFVVESVIDADAETNVAISRHLNYRNITDDATFLAAGLSDSSFTTVWSYVATEDLRFRVLKVKADTLGVFRVKVDGDVKDYFRTSPTDRNCRFYFIEDMDVPDTSTVTVDFRPERIRLSSYDFFFRVEAYTD